MRTNGEATAIVNHPEQLRTDIQGGELDKDPMNTRCVVCDRFCRRKSNGVRLHSSCEEARKAFHEQRTR